MKRLVLLLCLLSLSGVLTNSAHADPCNADLPGKGQRFEGPVTYIVDGDGFCVGHEMGGIEVRIDDFYACERSEPGGEQAAQILRDIALGKNATCVAGKKSWDRVIAHCEIGGRSVGELLRERGACEGGRGWKPRQR